MPFQKFQFRPGINREVTAYSNEGGWYDCDKVRFQKGFPESILGWTKKYNNSLLGSCSRIVAWSSLDSSRLTGFGTHLKLILDSSSGFQDITPIRLTSGAGDVTFIATNGNSSVVVSHAAHGANANDFVTFSGAVSLGGDITADVLNQEYQIQSVIDTNSYVIQARAVSDLLGTAVDGSISVTPVTANASDTGDGGSSVVGTYQIQTGQASANIGLGWGAGGWGQDGWGSASSTGVFSGSLRLWSMDAFGEDLIANPRNGDIYYWDFSVGGRAVSLSDLAGANKVPTIAKQVLVSDRDRHVIAFGCDPEANPGVQDPLIIRFSDQENVTDWESTALNTAGELRLGSGFEIVRAVETRQQILVFTDTTLYAMQYLGPPFTFGVGAVSENITIMSPRSVIASDDFVFWMGKKEFYVYSGTVQRLPCAVRDYVFSDFNENQSEKVFCGSNGRYSEIWWFYPSANSDDIDRYVIYNYLEQTWSIGTMGRTAWLDRGIFDYPLATDLNGYVYEHENGVTDGSTNPSQAIESYIESAPIDIADGEQFMLIRRMIPDLQFDGSTEPEPYADVTLSVRNSQSSPYSKSQTEVFRDPNTAPSDQRTDQLYYRLRGRQMRLRIDSTVRGVSWNLGSPRIDLRPDGRR
jgi:hypothetical protein